MLFKVITRGSERANNKLLYILSRFIFRHTRPPPHPPRFKQYTSTRLSTEHRKSLFKTLGLNPSPPVLFGRYGNEAR